MMSCYALLTKDYIYSCVRTCIFHTPAHDSRGFHFTKRCTTICDHSQDRFLSFTVEFLVLTNDLFPFIFAVSVH